MAEWTRETPWRQGQLLADGAWQSLGLSHSKDSEEMVVVVATHDCDLAQHPSVEPYVEVVMGRRIAKLDGNYTYAKNARTLHIQFDGNPPLFAEFSSLDKHSLEKNRFADLQPETNYQLSDSNRSVFQRWLAARYRRSAFPDEFERRLRTAKLDERIAKAVKPHGTKIIAVLFDVDEGREEVKVEPDDVYELGITLLYSIEPDSEESEKAAGTARAAIQSAFEKLRDPKSGQWKDIELRYLEVVSEEALSYRQFVLIKPWRLDYISLGADPQQPIVPE